MNWVHNSRSLLLVMDGLKASWKKAFTSKPRKFEGTGQKLGSGEAQAAAGHAPPRRKPVPKPAPPPPSPEGKRLGFAEQSDSFAPFSRPETGGAPRTWGGPPLGFTQQNDSGSPESGAISGSGVSPDHDGPQPSTESDEEPTSEEVESALAVLRCGPRSNAAVALLIKVLTNIVNAPSEQKFRRLRLQNKRVMEDLVNVEGGLEFLQACEFQLEFENDEGFAIFPEDANLDNIRSALAALMLYGVPAVSRPAHHQQQPPQHEPGAAAEPAAAAAAAPSLQQPASSRDAEATASRPPDDSSTRIHANGGPEELPTLPEPGSSNSSEAAAQPPTERSDLGNAAASPLSKLSMPVDRETQVILPMESSAAISEEIFRRTPAEVKASYLASRKKMEQSQMLMTRETRARLAGTGASRGKKHSHASIRVRMPDGLVLQGQFGASEQVSEVFTWVRDALRDPGQAYDLITPSRKPLVASDGSVTKADLAPSCLLTFRWLDRPPVSFGNELPTLADSYLALVRQ